MEAGARFIAEPIAREFIETYETLPELWDPKHQNYSNKYSREVALDKLVLVLRKACPNSTREDARMKINSMRSNYRREYKKVIWSRKTAIEEKDVYRPTSWNFHALQFLNRLEAFNFDVGEEINCESFDDTHPRSSSSPPPQTYGNDLSPKFMEPLTKRIKCDIPEPDDETSMEEVLLERATAHLDQAEDCDMMQARIWTSKLKYLDPMQRLYAEKAINDVLFEAALGNLKPPNSDQQRNLFSYQATREQQEY